MTLNLLARGLTHKEIADEMEIGISTVKANLYHLYDKLGAKNAPHAVHIAWHNNILPEE